VSLIRSVTEFEFTVNDTGLEQAATGTGDMAYVKGSRHCRRCPCASGC